MSGDPSPVDPPELVTVRLLGVPLRLWARAAERHQELLRECALLLVGARSGGHPPARLVAISSEIEARYGALSADQTALRENALAEGHEQVDLEFAVPTAIRDVALGLAGVLEEVDEFCRTDQMLLLETPPDIQAFRAWYLGQVIDQIDGGEPYPWEGPTA